MENPLFRRTYYIVLDTGNKLVSDIIETSNNLDKIEGLLNETDRLEEKYGSNMIILNWKRLKTVVVFNELPRH